MLKINKISRFGLIALLVFFNQYLSAAKESKSQIEQNETKTNHTDKQQQKSNSPADEFEQWKVGLKADVLAQDISEVLADKIILSLKYIPRVIELDRRQPESTMTHEEYLTKVIPEWKVKQARKAFRDNQQLLNQAEKLSGVKARFIVALWGKESNFGKITGKYHVPSALATLAFDGRRAKFFRKEFLAASKILAEGHIQLDEMLGSWAGAMGHCQFMPSSFLRYAVDADGDNKKDIWSNKTDVFASIANYLKESGWQADKTWGRQVKLTKNFQDYLIGKKHKKTLAQWHMQGIKRSDMTDLPQADMQGYLIAPGGKNGRVYLVYRNFDVIMRWNRSHYFATGVGYLADRIIYPNPLLEN